MGRYKLSEEDIPAWLLKLQPGHYTLKQIEELIGVGRNSVFMRLEALNVEKITTFKGARKINVYNWKGATYYWSRIYENRTKKMEKIIEDAYGKSA